MDCGAEGPDADGDGNGEGDCDCEGDGDGGSFGALLHATMLNNASVAVALFNSRLNAAQNTPPRQSMGSRRAGETRMGALGWISSVMTVALALAVVLAIRIAGQHEAGGFLGPGPLLADVNLVAEILLVLGLTVGMFMARAGNIEAHRRNQTTWVLVNLVFVVFLMAGAIASFKFKGFNDLKNLGNLVTWLHALFGTLAVAAGLWLVLQMNNLLPAAWHVKRWKGLMRATLAGYWLVAIGGLVTYYYWYAA